MVEQGSYIRAIKLSATDDPICPSANPEDYQDRKYNPGKSPPNGTELTGVLMHELHINGHLVIQTDSMNGQKYEDIWLTTKIKQVTWDQNGAVQVSTENSVYLLIPTMPGQLSSREVN